MVDFALWSVDTSDEPRRLTRSLPESETRLETWIEKAPELIRDGLVPIARQLIFPSRERLDLLCIEGQSRWVIVELKRDRMAREVVAQALDYVSLLQQMTTAELRERLLPHMEKLPAEDHDLALALLDAESDGTSREVAVVLAGVTADPALLRITQMLNHDYAVPVSVVELRAFATPAGDLLLAREETGDADTPAATDQSSGRTATTPESERWIRVEQQADRYGLSGALRSLRTSIEAAGLYARPYTRSVMITPPNQRTHYLAVVGFHGSGGRIMWGADAFREFYPQVDVEQAEELFGPPDTDREVDEAALIAFGEDLVTVMASANPSTAATAAAAAVADHVGGDGWVARQAPAGSVHDGVWYVTGPADNMIDDSIWMVLPDGTVTRATPVGNPSHPPSEL